MSNNKSLIQVGQSLCQFCKRKIISTNHELHEARCAMMSSRVRNEQYRNQVQKLEKPSHIGNVSFNKPSLSSRVVLGSELGANRGLQKIFNQPIKRQEQMVSQLIPCSNCGYMQTFAQLDTHPKECAHQEYECPYCKHSFPSILKDQHQLYCQAKQEQVHHQPPANRYPRQHIHRIESDQEQPEEELQHNHYFSNQNNQRRQIPMNNAPRIVQRTSTILNGRTIVEETDQFGNVRRREFQNGNRNGNEHHHHPIRSFSLEPFGNIERAGIFGNRGNPFADFFRLLENFASHGQQNQGLTKQQIKNLQKQKYKRPLQKPQTQQKDLCTICYCQFQQAQQIVKLRCKHLYHEQCIVKWLQSNAKCPVCKAPQTNRQIFNQDD